jgi:hypothetical protein
MITVTYEQMKGNLMSSLVNALGVNLPLAKRKLLLPLIEQLETFEKVCKKEANRLLFLYGTEAPENWPQAGQIVLEPVLMKEDEHTRFIEEEEALGNRSIELDWERIPVSIKKEMAEKISLPQLRVAEIIFDIQEK